MKLLIFAQSVLIAFLLGAFLIQYTATHSPQTGYIELLGTLEEYRRRGLEGCFAEGEIRHQESYCHLYNTLDVIIYLHK